MISLLFLCFLFFPEDAKKECKGLTKRVGPSTLFTKRHSLFPGRIAGGGTPSKHLLKIRWFPRRLYALLYFYHVSCRISIISVHFVAISKHFIAILGILTNIFSRPIDIRSVFGYDADSSSFSSFAAGPRRSGRRVTSPAAGGPT